MTDLTISGPAKPAVQSLTIQGAALTLAGVFIPPLLAKAGVVDLGQQQMLIQGGFALLGAIMTWVGRRNATQPVRGLFTAR